MGTLEEIMKTHPRFLAVDAQSQSQLLEIARLFDSMSPANKMAAIELLFVDEEDFLAHIRQALGLGEV